jgi:hypothetical protein
MSLPTAKILAVVRLKDNRTYYCSDDKDGVVYYVRKKKSSSL